MTTSSVAVLFSASTLAFLAVSAVALPNLSMASGTSFRSLPDTRQVAAVRSERQDQLVILFHGIRGRGSVMAAIGDSWKGTLPDTEFVAPDAPYAHRSGGRQWFAVDDQVMRPDRIQAARKAFDDLVSEIVEGEGFADALDKVAFVGVSQGAIMALDAVATGRWKVGALVSFAGLLPLPPTSSSTETRILLMHGGADRTIPSAASVAAKGQLEAAGYDVTLKLFPDVGHTISSEEAREAARFLQSHLD
ncbi:dienelactone hydrolase family protein [Rhizobium sp. NFR12]|uniref:alpha/beta hydrolase n=1 Tax=Rhizobium sp. NFR12 TaxID=1566261 RepID=UPI0008A7E478|nr:dienelactone hydrolase family protein [Rhizobium sp. NFR12]SEH24095.1 phospholipase/carboxylesterase [Rhizobium sp. NFR12]